VGEEAVEKGRDDAREETREHGILFLKVSPVMEGDLSGDFFVGFGVVWTVRV
jgi:hypothetical protein